MIEDVWQCFICGADTGTCVHLEDDLRAAVTARRDTWEDRNSESSSPVWKCRYRVVTKRRLTVDPPKLARGRMAWPANKISPETAFRRIE